MLAHREQMLEKREVVAVVGAALPCAGVVAGAGAVHLQHKTAIRSSKEGGAGHMRRSPHNHDGDRATGVMVEPCQAAQSMHHLRPQRAQRAGAAEVGEAKLLRMGC